MMVYIHIHVKCLIFLYYIYCLCFLAEGLKSHKFARPRFAKRRTCPSNAHWSWSWDAQRSLGGAKSQGSFPPPPPELDGSRIFFQIISFGNEALQKIGEVIVFFFLKTFSWHNSCLSARRKLGFLEDIWWRTSWTESLGLVVVSQFGNCWEGLKNGIRVVILYTVYIWTCRYCVYIIHIYIYVCVCVHSSWFFVLFKCSEFSELLWDPFQRLLKRNTPRFVGSVWLSLFPAQVE